MMEITTGWMEIYPVPLVTTWNTTWTLKSKSYGDTAPQKKFPNNLIDTWAEELSTEWVYHIFYHALASGKIE